MRKDTVGVPGLGGAVALEDAGYGRGERVQGDKGDCGVDEVSKCLFRGNGSVEVEDAEFGEAERDNVHDAVHPPCYQDSTDCCFQLGAFLLRYRQCCSSFVVAQDMAYWNSGLTWSASAAGLILVVVDDEVYPCENLTPCERCQLEVGRGGGGMLRTKAVSMRLSLADTEPIRQYRQ